MKQNNYIILCSFIVLVLSSFSSCEKEDFSVLPAETQSGKNTFGCYLNGEMYFGGYYPVTGAHALSAEYMRYTKKLIINSYGKINEKAAGIFYFEIDSPLENKQLLINLGYYLPENSNLSFFQYSVVNNGEIYLTRLDTVNKTLSGRFRFTGKSSDASFNFDGNDSINITEGRFDLKLTIYN